MIKIPYKRIGRKIFKVEKGRWTLKQIAGSPEKAKSTMKFLYGIESGWKPTGKKRVKTRVRKHRRFMKGKKVLVRQHNRLVKKTIRKEARLRSTPQTLFHAGDSPPSLRAERGEAVYGFSSKEFAEGWKEKHNKEDVYQFTTDDWKLDEKQFIRETPSGKKLSDNEFIAFNVLDEEQLDGEDEEKKEDTNG